MNDSSQQPSSDTGYIHPNLKLLSHSSDTLLNQCPRKYQIYKLKGGKDKEERNDSLFGTAVGDGIQELILTKNRNAAVWRAFLSWKSHLDFADDKAEEAKKLSWFVPVAIDSFLPHLETTLRGWEVAIFDGKPAKELSFQVDFGGGFVYRGYVDLVLYHPVRNLFLVLELKTTKVRSVDEAMYSNSMQGLGYGVVLDAIARAEGKSKPSSYEVLYAVYKSTAFGWELLPFKKSTLKRIQWLQQIITQVARIQTYAAHNYWPAHGDNCYAFFRRCEYYGICNLSVQHLCGVKEISQIPFTDENKSYQFTFTAAELLANIVEGESVVQESESGLDPDADMLLGEGVLPAPEDERIL